MRKPAKLLLLAVAFEEWERLVRSKRSKPRLTGFELLWYAANVPIDASGDVEVLASESRKSSY